MGTPSPPPPPNIPNLKEKTSLAASTVRQRLAAHRENKACAACHDRIDPLGFALENYDAVGRWRNFDGTLKIDSSGVSPSGEKLNSVDSLEATIVNRPKIFARALTEKLLTYAIGRPLLPSDGPYVREIVERASQNDFRFSELVQGIIQSKPFRMRSVQ